VFDDEGAQFAKGSRGGIDSEEWMLEALGEKLTADRIAHAAQDFGSAAEAGRLGPKTIRGERGVEADEFLQSACDQDGVGIPATSCFQGLKTGVGCG